MKKNKMMRLASAMMVLTLMSTSVISGTFAKYVTSDSATDTARVAKWGVNVVATDQTMFSTSYIGTDSKTTVEVGGGLTDKLVAPGTSRDAIDLFSITGQPEVAVKIEISINDSTKKDVFLKAGKYSNMITGGDATDSFEFSGDSYYPVVFILKNDGSEVAKGNLAVIEEYLESTVSKAYVAPNTNLTTTYGTYTLEWAWEFPSTEDTLVDQKDTLLGNLAANPSILAKHDGTDFVALTVDSDFSTTLNFDLSVTVTQVD